VVLVRKRTIPTERPQPADEVSANTKHLNSTHIKTKYLGMTQRKHACKAICTTIEINQHNRDLRKEPLMLHRPMFHQSTDINGFIFAL
jgi:hypothetical protein